MRGRPVEIHNPGMRIARRLMDAADSVPEASRSMVDAAERLRRGVDVATMAIIAALALAASAVLLALAAIGSRETR